MLGPRIPRRRGFTILEITLVLAVIALIAFVSYPSFQAWFDGQKLGEGVDKVRTQWIKVRTQAMEEGQAYRFSWESNSGRYRLAPDDMENWPDLAGAANGPHLGTTGAGVGLVIEAALPDGVHFVSSDANSGDAIIFQSNGTAKILASDGTEKPETQVVFADRHNQMRALRIRGLTGVVTVEGVAKQ